MAERGIDISGQTSKVFADSMEADEGGPGVGRLVAVGELCTNSIVHAYDGAPGGPIRVSVRGFDDRVEVMVEDVGDAFDPAHDTPPRLPGAPGDDSALRERSVVSTWSGSWSIGCRRTRRARRATAGRW